MIDIEIFTGFIINQWSKHCHCDDDVQLDGIIGNVAVMIRVYMNYGIDEELMITSTTLDEECLEDYF